MAVTPVSTVKFFANNKVTCCCHASTTNATAQTAKSGATTATWIAMRDYEGIAMLAASSVLGGNGVEVLSIYVATSSAGANPALAKTGNTVVGDALADMVVLEISAADIAQLGSLAGVEYTHVIAWVECQHNDDEVIVTYIQHGAKRPAAGLTADVIA